MPRQHDAAAPLPKRSSAARIGGEPVIRRELYRPGPLRDDIERLASPAAPMADGDILSLLLKYFHASLFPGSEGHALPLSELSSLLGHFYDLRPADDGTAPETGDALALRMLADLPRTAHAFRSVANRPLPPFAVQDPFLGIDCGTGSGIILTAAWLQAKRNGVSGTRLFGLETDAAVADRTGRLLAGLGIGEVRVADARDPASYAALPEGPVAFVGNENIPAVPARLATEPFCAIHAALFTAMAGRLKKTVFFPESLVVRDREAELDVVLSGNNRFQMPRHYRQLRARPRAIVIEGRLTRLRQVGKGFREAIPEAWLGVMPDRW